MINYSFGVPSPAIWIFHIIIGFFLAYIGYMLLNNKQISQLFIIELIVLGVFASLYHAHLYYYYTYGEKKISSSEEHYNAVIQ